jgi:hypothetical protein
MLGDIGAGLGGTIGGIAVLAGAGGKGGMDEYKEAIELLRKVQEPDFDAHELTAPQLKIFAEYFPEVYKAVVPDEVKLVAESPEARTSQVESLAKLEQIRDQGLPIGERIAAQQAGQRLAGEMAGADKYVMRDLAQRGRLGGGEELSGRMMSNQTAADMANQMGSNLALQASQNRLMGAQGAFQAAGGLRGQDIARNQMNADYANRFNEMVTGRQMQANAAAAGARNEGQLYNVGQQQRIGESNVMNTYANQARNQEYANQLKQQAYNNAYQKASAMAGLTQDLGNQKNLEKAMKDQQILGLGQSVGRLGGGIAGLGMGGLGGGSGGASGGMGAGSTMGGGAGYFLQDQLNRQRYY